ncbi:MAG: SH3 domain-containing protein [Prevotella sp.]|nr:SH3 domain-containing protein [Prevotella sp.]
MKRLFISFIALLAVCTMSAQRVFTVVYAISDDGFVNLRQSPSAKARIIGRIMQFNHGLGDGVLLGESRGNWAKVRVGNVTGWANANYLGTMTWVKGVSPTKIIAKSPRTNIYRETYVDGESKAFYSWVPKGTILADDFGEEGQFYVLKSAHDNLYVNKKDVFVQRR